MQHRPRHCDAKPPWFLIISQIKVRFILSFFFTTTDSSRETREYAQSWGILAARSGKRQPDEFASDATARPMCPEYYFHAFRIHTDTERFSVCRSILPWSIKSISNFFANDRVTKNNICLRTNINDWYIRNVVKFNSIKKKTFARLLRNWNYTKRKIVKWWIMKKKLFAACFYYTICVNLTKHIIYYLEI